MTDYWTKDDLLADRDINEKLDQLPSDDELQETVEHIQKRNIDVTVFDAPDEVREYLISLIPRGASVMNGHSTTLQEIGFTDALENNGEFEYLAPSIRALEDAEERREARRKSVSTDVFFDGVNAIASTGELVGVNGKGTSLGAWPYPADRLVLVSGTNKIVPTLDDAMDRVREVAYPLEDARVEAAQNHGSVIGKWMIYEHEKRDDRTELVLIDGTFGF